MKYDNIMYNLVWQEVNQVAPYILRFPTAREAERELLDIQAGVDLKWARIEKVTTELHSAIDFEAKKLGG